MECRSVLHFVAEVGTGFELHDLLGRDLDLFAGLRVAAFAGGTLGDAEGAEADEGHAVTFFQRFRGVVHEGIQRTLGVGFGDLRFGGDRLDQFGFVQAHGCGWLVVVEFVTRDESILKTAPVKGFRANLRKMLKNQGFCS